MPILKSLGLGIFIITLKLLLPRVLDEGEGMTIAVLHGVRVSAETASSLVANAASASRPLLLTLSSILLHPSAFPQTTPIPSY